ncbi:MAG: PAS domain-containing sensor histidine kinase [Candidatus Thermoplasmatota archaeon]|nr:PAS domain-containing sensor histidine kinase [Candidatus Thermoplasmatota archaeon]
MIYTIGWWILLLITIGLGAWSVHLYFLDKDKRKLIISIVFFLSTFIFIFNAIDSPALRENILLLNLFQWLTIIIMTALFIAVVESFYSSKDFEKEFILFIIFLLGSYGLIFLPFEIGVFLKYVRLSITAAIIPFSLYQFAKWKNMQSLFFFTAVISFSIAGIGHAYGQAALSIFAYGMAYTFITIVFLLPISNTNLKITGIGLYFSLQKQLNQTQLQLEESKELYKNIVENTQDVILLTNPNGANTYVSPSSKQILGYTSQEMMDSKSWPFKIHPDDNQSVMNAMKKGYAGYPGYNFEYRIIKKDENVRWISHSWSPIKKNGQLHSIVSSMRDVTELKQMQQTLAEQVNRLQQNELATLNILEDFQNSISSLKEIRKQIEEKNKQLQKSEEKLKKFNDELERRVIDRTKEVDRLLKQKDVFIDQLSHDLKHPLGPLINLLPLLKKQETDKKNKEILTVLERNVDYMKKLVIRTVELAKLNAPSTTFEFETVHLIDFVQTIIEKNDVFFKENDVQISTNINDNLFLTIDTLQIEEVIENLFSNAVKYGSTHGTITINAEKHSDDYALISIKDTGHGLTTEQTEVVFDEFQKADESRHDFLSTGLGLSICKRIVEKHGGRIWAESTGLGEGTTVNLTLPLAKEERIERYLPS